MRARPLSSARRRKDHGAPGSTVKADIAKKIDAVILNGVAPALKAHGFQRRQRRFTKPLGKCTWVAEVKSGPYNQGSQGRFSVEIGVFHPLWHEQLQALPRLRHQEPLSDPPRIWHCQVREDLGLLATRNTWWPIDDSTNLEATSAAVAQAVAGFALPWFKAMSSLPAAVSSIAGAYGHLQGAWIHKIHAMVGYAALGDIVNAARLYQAADGDVITSEEQDREFGAWARQRGILPAAT